MTASKVRILIAAPILQISHWEVHFEMTNQGEKKVGESHSERQKNWVCSEWKPQDAITHAHLL